MTEAYQSYVELPRPLEKIANVSDTIPNSYEVMSIVRNGYLLNCMHKQQDFFGCLAEILGCLGLREAANLEI